MQIRRNSHYRKVGILKQMLIFCQISFGHERERRRCHGGFIVYFLLRSFCFFKKGAFFILDNRAYYIALLIDTAEKHGRLPKKSDFSEEDVNKIKGLFGPWPWALEAAGLKESKREAKLQKNRAKRKAAKEKRQKKQ